MPNYFSNRKPDFTPRKINCGSINAYQYQGSLTDELESKKVTKQQAVDFLEDMLIVREFEEMIVKLRSGAYAACAGFDYRGPTHVSIGQEAASVGGCIGIAPWDYITSTHRGHGDSIAKGCVTIRAMDEATLRKRVPDCPAKGKELVEAALEHHIYRTAAEVARWGRTSRRGCADARPHTHPRPGGAFRRGVVRCGTSAAIEMNQYPVLAVDGLLLAVPLRLSLLLAALPLGFRALLLGLITLLTLLVVRGPLALHGLPVGVKEMLGLMADYRP